MCVCVCVCGHVCVCVYVCVCTLASASVASSGMGPFYARLLCGATSSVIYHSSWAEEWSAALALCALASRHLKQSKVAFQPAAAVNAETDAGVYNVFPPELPSLAVGEQMVGKCGKSFAEGFLLGY